MNKLLPPGIIAIGLFAISSVASANTMTFGTVIGSPGADLSNPYVEDGISATALQGHFDIGAFLANPELGGTASNSVGVIHRGNGGEQVQFTFSGGLFNLLGVDITGWSLDKDTSLTATFTSSSGSHSVNASATGHIDFTGIAGFAGITSFTFSVPLGVGACVGDASCPEVGFDNISLEAPRVGGETPIPAALPLFATGLGILGFGAYRRKRQTLAP